MAIDKRSSTIECPGDRLANSFYLRLARSAGFGSDAFRGLMVVTVNIRKRSQARGQRRATGRKKMARTRGR